MNKEQLNDILKNHKKWLDQARKEKGLETTWETPEQVFEWWTSFD